MDFVHAGVLRTFRVLDEDKMQIIIWINTIEGPQEIVLPNRTQNVPHQDREPKGDPFHFDILFRIALLTLRRYQVEVVFPNLFLHCQYKNYIVSFSLYNR